MGRTPKMLTDLQKVEIQRRLATGESYRSVAKDFPVGEATLRRNFAAQAAKIRSVANKLATVEGEMLEMPVSAQQAARGMADDLRAINGNVARAVRTGSETAVFLSAAAQARAREALLVEPKDGRRVDPIAAMEADGLQIAANRALSPAMRLIAATMGKDAPADEPEDRPTLSTLSDAELDQLITLQEKAGGGA